MTPFEEAICDPKNFNMKGATKANCVAHGIPWPLQKGWRTEARKRILARIEGIGTRSPLFDAAVVGYLGGYA